MHDSVSRRDFIGTCSVLAAALTACAGTRTRTGALFTANPSLDEYGDVLRALVTTVVPVGASDFPLDAATVESRLLRMFPLEHERRFLGLQKTLVYFNQLDLFPHAAAPLLDAERTALDVPERMTEEEFKHVAAAKAQTDAKACEDFLRRAGEARTFVDLGHDARGEWLGLWSASELTVKRDFSRSIRALILISVYSADAMWPSIGYDGPFLREHPRGV